MAILPHKGMLPANVLKNAASRANENVTLMSEIVFATVHVTDDDIRFCDGPRMLI